ncbi:DUF3089 domain-containing protein [Novosphingobium sp. 1949]|uniref:DUF3089 domain-containing protein n=1 Tax=Novosphingobium organovorum TaxID=2930092 RepID=A0ABT0BDQ7_9SPHN|nr:DUF3089 domain-containing protein [Novosphingobium organovorum]MCJ2183176.1 DUF3089 domain-containing protein [Novosphingobium organovorum]
MARKFLYIVAVCLVLFVAARLAMIYFADELSEIAFVPGQEFEPQPPKAPADWNDPALWVARPGLANDPSRWLPKGASRAPQGTARAAVFFIHPTSYMDKAHWNAPLDDAAANTRARLFTQAMASAFTAAGDVWAPRYRQATIGAFFTDRAEADKALDLAYADVRAAFAVFLRENPKGPIVLAAHSQGSLLLRRLMRDAVAGKPVARRVVAAYLPGWPVSLDHDLPRMGLPACTSDNQSGCVLSWLSVADPADTSALLKGYARQRGLDGQPVAGSAFLCSDPLTGSQDGQSDAGGNLGTLVPDFEHRTGVLVPQTVPAACGPDNFLHIGPPPKLDMGEYVLPGNNYHVYDITLFWENLRADARKRLTAWIAAQDAAPEQSAPQEPSAP